MRFLKNVLLPIVVVLGLLRSAAGTASAEDKPTITVGSKDFTESIILGEMIAVLLEDRGYSVERQMNLGGTAVVHEAMVNGDVDVDVYAEYTGTGLLAILGQELPEVDADAAADSATPAASPLAGQGYDIVASEYPEQFGLAWLEPWGFNNTYVMAVRGETAEELGLTTISDGGPRG